MTSGMIGGLIGGIGGAVGGIIGTYCSIKNTNGPRERRFMIKAGIVCWIGIIIFLLLLCLLPKPYNFFLWIPYGILLPLGIVKGNKAQQRIRQEEAAEKKTHGSERQIDATT